ncbi:MAG: hypothetical protein JXA96_13730 [Sedimentisphaerales bacterium]|nr:hypothetical protein [Sedimentisphaerales bacterium]
MNNDKENQIRFRLKVISQIEPKEQAITSAIEKTKDVLAKSQKQKDDNVVRTSGAFICGQILKYAIAAVILIGVGFIAGRLAIPAQPEINMEEIQTMMDKKCADNAEKILAASSTLMDKRMYEMVNVIEAARQKDRQWTAAAFDKVVTDNDRMGKSIIALASRTN